jgi:3-phenylpropionate/trans-cinnamate dioxygenase ferredoxin subunit
MHVSVATSFEGPRPSLESLLRESEKPVSPNSTMSDSATATTIQVCPAEELGPGQSRIFDADGRKVGVFNAGGELYAIEDRCSHDDGPLAEGPFNPDRRTVECPRHGSLFDLTTGRPNTLPAYLPVDTFPVRVEDGMIKVEVR